MGKITSTLYNVGREDQQRRQLRVTWSFTSGSSVRWTIVEGWLHGAEKSQQAIHHPQPLSLVRGRQQGLDGQRHWSNSVMSIHFSMFSCIHYSERLIGMHSIDALRVGNQSFRTLCSCTCGEAIRAQKMLGVGSAARWRFGKEVTGLGISFPMLMEEPPQSLRAQGGSHITVQSTLQRPCSLHPKQLIFFFWRLE